MMIYVFGDLRQLRSFELARLPVIESSNSSSSKTEKEKKPVLKLFSTHPASGDGPNNTGDSIQPFTSPSPFLRQSVSGDSATSPPNSPTSFASISPLSRPPPPKLRLDPPPPAHMFTHIQTSSRADPTYSSMSSMPSGSQRDKLKYLLRTSASGCNVDDDASGSDSDYDSDYETGSETDASSQASHDSRDSAEDARTTTTGQEKRLRAHRRRRREPEIHISDAIFDEDPSPEGPATADPQERRRSSVWGGSSEEDVGTGATFIHPFQWDQLAECVHLYRGVLPSLSASHLAPSALMMSNHKRNVRCSTNVSMLSISMVCPSEHDDKVARSQQRHRHHLPRRQPSHFLMWLHRFPPQTRRSLPVAFTLPSIPKPLVVHQLQPHPRIAKEPQPGGGQPSVSYSRSVAPAMWQCTSLVARETRRRP